MLLLSRYIRTIDENYDRPKEKTGAAVAEDEVKNYVIF